MSTSASASIGWRGENKPSRSPEGRSPEAPPGGGPMMLQRGQRAPLPGSALGAPIELRCVIEGPPMSDLRLLLALPRRGRQAGRGADHRGHRPPRHRRCAAGQPPARLHPRPGPARPRGRPPRARARHHRGRPGPRGLGPGHPQRAGELGAGWAGPGRVCLLVGGFWRRGGPAAAPALPQRRLAGLGPLRGLPRRPAQPRRPVRRRPDRPRRGRRGRPAARAPPERRPQPRGPRGRRPPPEPRARRPACPCPKSTPAARRPRCPPT
jgi:hypothetical protein